MIVVLDASAAIRIVLRVHAIENFSEQIKKAEWVIAPDLYISEVTNVYWKYHQFEDMPLDICESALNRTILLVDDLIKTGELYREAFSFSCQSGISVYDSIYLICTRRHNATLLSFDKKLNRIAQKYAIRTT